MNVHSNLTSKILLTGICFGIIITGYASGEIFTNIIVPTSSSSSTTSSIIIPTTVILGPIPAVSTNIVSGIPSTSSSSSNIISPTIAVVPPIPGIIDTTIVPIIATALGISHDVSSDSNTQTPSSSTATHRVLVQTGTTYTDLSLPSVRTTTAIHSTRTFEGTVYPIELIPPVTTSNAIKRTIVSEGTVYDLGPIDSDGDGFPVGEDCNDSESSIYPGAEEIPYNDIDEDCDGEDLCDVDADTFCAEEAGGTDCDDSESAIFPGASEVCTDGIDNDCDGLVDLADSICQSDEVCDGLDNDGDGLIDEDFIDLGNPCSVGVGACQADSVKICTSDGTATQCNANEGTPSAELCDTIDNDCDGTIDNDVDETDPNLGVTCSLPFEVGECRNGFNICTEEGLVCEGQSPTEESCDGLDNDCDGSTDENETGGSVCTIPVTIDVQPDSYNCNGKGVIPIVIFATSAFDPLQLDLSTIRVDGAPATEKHGKLHAEDIDSDGLVDAMFHLDVAVQELPACETSPLGQTFIPFSGSLHDGTQVDGGDDIILKGKKIKEN